MSRPPANQRRGTLGAVAGTAALIFLGAGLLLHSRLKSVPAPTPSQSDLSRQDAWTALGGIWRASPYGIESTSRERGAKLITRLGDWQNYQVQADIQITEQNGEAGLMLRTTGEEEGIDAYHGYFAGVRRMDSSLEFGRADFGWLPLVGIDLPPAIDLQGWIHLRVVAFGCTFGVVITLPDHQSRAAVAEDNRCIASGHFGLRSTFTNAWWKNIKVEPASLEDIRSIEAQSQGSEVLPALEPLAGDRVQQRESSMRTEAKMHGLQAGVQPIAQFLMVPGRHPNITLQGVVISTQPFTDIQDDSGAIIVPHVDPKTFLKLGDVVEAKGTLISERFRSRLEDAKIRVLWSEMPIPPLAVTASLLTGGTYRGRSIEVEGTLVSVTSHATGYELILRDGDLTFRGMGSSNFQTNLANLAIGSRIRLSGIATSLPEFTQNVFPFAIFIDHAGLVSAPPWWSPRHVALLLILCAVLLLCSQLAVHRLQQWHLQSVLNEREQLAFEMHDTLAQSFTGIAYQLKAASMERRGESRIQAHISNALHMVHLSHKEASRTIAALRPQFRDAATILSALKEFAERLSDSGPLAVSTHLTGRNTRLPLQVTDALFRIGQEAISNAVHHAACTTLTLDLALSKRQVRFHVWDNGHGFDGKMSHPGLGIAGMRTRAEKIRAQFDIESGLGAGTAITVRVPLLITGGALNMLRDIFRPVSRARE